MRANYKLLAISLLGLAALISWQALSLRSYARRDSRPPAWDQAIHLEIAHDYRLALKEGRLGDIVHLAPKPGMPPFPPLYHLLLAKHYDPANPAGAAIAMNWLYLALLSLALFGIAWHFRPDETALLATVAFVCSPAVMDLATTQLVDLSVVAWSATAFWLLLKTDEFRSWPWSIAFGVAFATGMMHKWSFFAYMIPAYFLGLKALGDRRSRLQALASLAVALVLFAPWYYVHLPVLVPRLFQASADFAVPFWQGGAFFQYFLNSADALGPVFWALGWVGLLAAHPRRYADYVWLVLAWVGFSYLFWAIVPNRQLRFLLPGLPGLAVAAAMAWPTAILWFLAVFQALTALNYTAGWLGPIPLPLPLVSMNLLPNDPPRREDWQIAEILKEAERRAEPDEPIANVTLIANAQRFNGPTFTWMVKELGLAKVHMRGVNRRLCELSQFVVLKEGDLGPAGVISGLPEAAKVVEEKNGWFRKAYDEAGRYKLADGTAAVLFQRRKLAAAPFKSKGTQFEFYESEALKGSNLKVELGAFDSASGVYPKATLSAASVDIRGLTVSHPALDFEGLALVSTAKPPQNEWDDVRLIKLKRLTLRSGEVNVESLKPFLEKRIKNLKVRRLELENGAITLEGAFASVVLSAVLTPELRPDALVLRLGEVRLGASPLPAGMLGRFREIVVPFTPNPETPFFISVPSLKISGGKLTIGS